MLTIGYARTSRDDQDLARQIKQIKEAGVPEHLIFRDAGVSGAKAPEQRPGYRQMAQLLNTGEVEALYVTDISRLGRDAKGTLQEIWKLQDQHIRIVSLDPLDTFVLNATPELQPLLTSAVTLGADLQRKKIIEDTKAGLRRATEEGRPPGRPRVEVDWNRLEAWRAKGLSYRTAAIVEGYSQSTLRRRMRERLNKQAQEA